LITLDTAPESSLDNVEARFRAFIEDRDFPCVGAKSALSRGTLRTVRCRSITSGWNDLVIYEALLDWSQAYRDDGLVVLGVHTPEFAFEHDAGLVEQAASARRIAYPIAVDNDYAVWNAFDNHYWPAVYLIDREGIVRWKVENGLGQARDLSAYREALASHG
jgi:hypothetical protein